MIFRMMGLIFGITAFDLRFPSFPINSGLGNNGSRLIRLRFHCVQLLEAGGSLGFVHLRSDFIRASAHYARQAIHDLLVIFPRPVVFLPPPRRIGATADQADRSLPFTVHDSRFTSYNFPNDKSPMILIIFPSCSTRRSRFGKALGRRLFSSWIVSSSMRVMTDFGTD